MGRLLWYLFRFTFRVVMTLAVIVVAVVVWRAFESRNMPDLQLWHRAALDAELTADDITTDMALADYLAREERLFNELNRDVYARVPGRKHRMLNRFYADSIVHPENLPNNWNRSFELVPDTIRGGVLMVHGLTDSPYSMRHAARIFYEQGFYVLVLRMPGHGTVPAGLATARWEDWMAAVKLGARHVRGVAGEDLPFHLVGYSNGGALAVKYTLDALEYRALAVPDRLFLFSPMLGVTQLSRFTGVHSLFSFSDYFEKFKWLSVLPEFNPFKYNSFPKNGGRQSFRLTSAVYAQIVRMLLGDELDGLPPVLTFHSVVDSTVQTAAVVTTLYDNWPVEDSELVLFDVNRYSEFVPFVESRHDDALSGLLENPERPFRLTLITNEHEGSRRVEERSRPASSVEESRRRLDLSWPPYAYSLSHVAIPFPPTDPLYGGEPDGSMGEILELGTLVARGERGVLRVPGGDVMRMQYNPFFRYIEQRLREVLAE